MQEEYRAVVPLDAIDDTGDGTAFVPETVPVSRADDVAGFRFRPGGSP